MATSIPPSAILTIDGSAYSVQDAGRPWSLQQVGPEAYRFEVRAGEGWSMDNASRNRSEISMKSVIPDGKQIDVSYALSVDPGAANTAPFTILGQFHQDEGEAVYGLAPPFSIGLSGEHMVVNIGYRNAAGQNIVDTIFTDANAITRGHAYAFDIRATFDPTGNAHISVYRDGIRIVDYVGPAGWPGQAGVYWKEGIYRAAAEETLAATYDALSVDISDPPDAGPPDYPMPVTYHQYGADGAIVATVTTAADGARSVQSFDASGALIKLVSTAPSGAMDVTTYGLTGRTYTSETVHFDASGTVTSIATHHADGSLDSRQERHANGGLENWKYDASGKMTWHEVIHSQGGRDVYEFVPAGNATETLHRAYDTAGVLRLQEQKFPDGTLDFKRVWNADGSRLDTDYDVGGSIVSICLTQADGSRVFSTFGITGTTYVATESHYNPAGVLVWLERTHADGTLDSSFVKDASGTCTKTFDALGKLVKVDKYLADGTRDVLDYSIPGNATETVHRSYDSGGTLRLYEMKNANGTLDYVRSWNADGALTARDYDGNGNFLSVANFRPNGNAEYSFAKVSDGTIAKFYDTAGALVKNEHVFTDGHREVFDYGFAGRATPSTHRVYDSGGRLSLYEKYLTDGKIDISQRWNADGSTLIKDYNGLGILVSDTLVHADGSRTVDAYGITGKPFTSTETEFDAAGRMTALTRFHADGTREYHFEKGAGGTLAQFYDSAGTLVKVEHIDIANNRDVYDYAFANKAFESTHRSYDASGTLRLLENRNSDGSLDLVKLWHTDGSATVRDYDSHGTLVSVTEVHADNSSDVSQYGITGKPYTSVQSTYDPQGSLVSMTRYHADGTRDYAFENAVDGTRARFYDASGALTKLEHTLTDGSREVFDYGIVNQPYTRSERYYDAANHLISMTTETSGGDRALTAYAQGITLTSGAGDDLISTFGSDTIVFGSHFGDDLVRNFHAGSGAGHDVIAIDDALVADFAHLSMQQQGNDVVITVEGHGTIRLDHVQLSALHPTDFLFY